MTPHHECTQVFGLGIRRYEISIYSQPTSSHSTTPTHKHTNLTLGSWKESDGYSGQADFFVFIYAQPVD